VVEGILWPKRRCLWMNIDFASFLSVDLEIARARNLELDRQIHLQLVN
jgi:hypothetical protein